MIGKALVVILAAGMSALLVAQELDTSRYKASRLLDIIEHSKRTQHVDPLEADIVTGSASYSVTLEWSGKRRAIDPGAKGFFALWLKMCGLPAGHADLFQEELCFKEGAAEYWLPVQAPLVKDMVSDLKPGAKIRAYIVWLGSVGNERFYFIVNGYDDL